MARDRKANRNRDRLALGDRLRELRGLRGMTQGGLSAASGVPVARMAKHETAASYPSSEDVVAYAGALGVSPSSLRIADVDRRGVNLAARLLWQVADVYGLVPWTCGGYAYLRPTTASMRAFLASWAAAYAPWSASGGERERRDYLLWKYACEPAFDPDEFPLRYPAFDPAAAAPGAWEGHCLSAQLAHARRRLGVTQEAAGPMAGMSAMSWRNYEAGRRLLDPGQEDAVAGALGIRPESLVFYDLPFPDACHALMDLATEYLLRPDALEDGTPVLRTMGPGLEAVIDNWAAAHARHEVDGDLEAYWLWRDTYDVFDTSNRVATRYRHVVEDGRLTRFMESDADPWRGFEARA